MEQWPLTKQKLEALHQLTDEQLKLGNIRPTMSPWNTPVFVIRKASGAWHMLQDLRKVNDRMELVGTPLQGMPWIPAISTDFSIAVIDLKDCFFSIPLHPKDCAKFVFSVLSLNYSQPDC